LRRHRAVLARTALGIGLGAGTRLAAGAPASDAGPYHLGNPVPREAMRELATDRPDKTEVPFTVDAGHFQLEMDLFSYSYDSLNVEGADRVEEAWAFGPINLKLGLLANLDAEVVFEAYREVQTTDRTGPTEAMTRRSGIGDTVLRAKLNFWGNDGGPTALGILPALKLPTSQDDLRSPHVGGGILLPFYAELPWELELGMGSGWGLFREEDAADYHHELVNSIGLGRRFGRYWSGYIEFWTLLDPDASADWEGTFDFGVNYWFTEDFKLDAGLNFGVTPAAPDWQPFLGLSWRY
jgi:hypothetical protein